MTLSAEREGSAAKSATFTLYPPNLTGLTLDASNVVGGSVVHGTAVFNGPPASAGALVAKLSADSPSLVQMPPSVSVEANKTVATFDIHTAGIAANKQVTLTAAQGDRKETATLTITPAVLTDFVRTEPCRCGALTATLNGGAPAGGLALAIASNNPNAATVPASITIPAGAKSGTVDVAKHESYSGPQHATISASLNGVTKKWDEYVLAKIKPDLVIKTVTLQDRYGNTITQPQDSQPFKACITVAAYGYHDLGDFQYPGVSKMRVSYLSPIPGGTSAGREFDVDVPSFKSYPVHISSDEKYLYLDPICVDLPGVQPNSYLDLTLTADSTNQIDESNEGNNTNKSRIKR